MEPLTPAMIYCLTLFQGFKQTTRCYCYNRRRGKKAQPRKAKPFSICAFMSFITEKNNYESSSPAFANLWLLLVYNVTGGPNLTGNPNRSQPDPNPGQLPSGLPWAEGECNRNYCKSALWSMRFTLTEMELTVNV